MKLYGSSARYKGSGVSVLHSLLTSRQTSMFRRDLAILAVFLVSACCLLPIASARSWNYPPGDFADKVSFFPTWTMSGCLMEWLPIETRVTLRTVLIHPYDVLTPGCCCRTSLKRSRIFSLQYQQDQCRSDGHHGEFASLPLLPPQYDDEIVSKQIIKYVATCTGMHLSLPTYLPSIHPIHPIAASANTTG